MSATKHSPREICLAALRSLTQLDLDVYYTSNAVGSKIYDEHKLSLADATIKTHLENLVGSGIAEKVLISGGYSHKNENSRYRAISGYRATFTLGFKPHNQ
jgi:hypothetical protein